MEVVKHDDEASGAGDMLQSGYYCLIQQISLRPRLGFDPRLRR
jgi:hypothetical protein